MSYVFYLIVFFYFCAGIFKSIKTSETTKYTLRGREKHKTIHIKKHALVDRLLILQINKFVALVALPILKIITGLMETLEKHG